MKIEVRSTIEAVISGYVNAVMRDSRKMPRCVGTDKVFVERVRDGTFAKAIQKNDCVELRYNHERVLCDTKSGLELREDAVGLYASAVVHDSEVIEKARKGELRGWSFGFICNKDTWDKDGDTERRTLEDIQLLEVSILDKTPAYFGTSVETRGNDVLEQRGSDGLEVEIAVDNNKLNRMKLELEILKVK